MKFFRSFFCLIILGIFLTISNVSADSNGSILIEGTSKDEKYSLYKILDLKCENDECIYIINEKWKNFFDKNGKNYLSDNNENDNLEILFEENKKYLNINDENLEQFKEDLIKNLKEIKQDNNTKKAVEDTLLFDKLLLGYYLVYNDSVSKENGVICLLDENNSNIKIKFRNLSEFLGISVNDQNVEIGQIIQFKIEGMVPDTKGYESYTYKITNNITKGLELDQEIIQFSVKFDDKVIDIKPIYEDNSFILNFDMVNYQKYVNKKIVITFKLRVTEDVVNNDEVKNVTTLTYSNNFKNNDDIGTNINVIKVYSSEINIVRVDEKDENIKLDGSKLILKNRDNKYYQALDKDKKLITNLSNTNGVYDVNWVDKLESATVLVTDEDGKTNFKGIENGTYYLEEVESPKNYEKFTDKMTIKVGYKEDDKSLINQGDSVVYVVKNNVDPVMAEINEIKPELFVVAGSVLTIIPIIVYLVTQHVK